VKKWSYASCVDRFAPPVLTLGARLLPALKITAAVGHQLVCICLTNITRYTMCVNKLTCHKWYVCVCVDTMSVHVLPFVCLCAGVYAWTQTDVYLFVSLNVCVCVCVCVCACAHTCSCIKVGVCLACVSVLMCLCVFVCIPHLYAPLWPKACCRMGVSMRTVLRSGKLLRLGRQPGGGTTCLVLNSFMSVQELCLYVCA
jgi:hypothetical protein